MRSFVKTCMFAFVLFAIIVMLCMRPWILYSYAISFAPSIRTSAPHYLIFIVVLSTSTRKGRDARDTVRRTWAQDCRNRSPPLLVKFAIGTLELSSSETEDLSAEDKTYGDLLLLTNLHDSYNLTRKVLYSFLWADQNVKFFYMLKVDDNTYVFVDGLYKAAYRYHQDGINKLYWGHFNWKGSVKDHTQTKYAEYNWFLCDHYLPYAYGGGYVISADLIRKIAITADCLQLYNNEDVSVGVWLSAYKIQRKEDKHFCTKPSVNHNCTAHACLLLTAVTKQEMYKLHSQ